MHAVAQVGIGEFAVAATGIDLDPQVEVAFANLEQIHPGPQLARDGLRGVALDVDLGRKFDQRLGIEAAQTSGKE
jgi:hypothetical protein